MHLEEKAQGNVFHPSAQRLRRRARVVRRRVFVRRRFVGRVRRRRRSDGFDGPERRRVGGFDGPERRRVGGVDGPERRRVGGFDGPERRRVGLPPPDDLHDGAGGEGDRALSPFLTPGVVQPMQPTAKLVYSTVASGNFCLT